MSSLPDARGRIGENGAAELPTAPPKHNSSIKLPKAQPIFLSPVFCQYDY